MMPRPVAVRKCGSGRAKCASRMCAANRSGFADSEEWFSAKDLYRGRVETNLADMIGRASASKRPVLLRAVSNSPGKDALLVGGFCPQVSRDDKRQQVLLELVTRIAGDRGERFDRAGDNVRSLFRTEAPRRSCFSTDGRDAEACGKSYQERASGDEWSGDREFQGGLLTIQVPAEK